MQIQVKIVDVQLLLEKGQKPTVLMKREQGLQAEWRVLQNSVFSQELQWAIDRQSLSVRVPLIGHALLTEAEQLMEVGIQIGSRLFEIAPRRPDADLLVIFLSKLVQSWDEQDQPVAVETYLGAAFRLPGGS